MALQAPRRGRNVSKPVLNIGWQFHEKVEKMEYLELAAMHYLSGYCCWGLVSGLLSVVQFIRVLPGEVSGLLSVVPATSACAYTRVFVVE